MSPRDGFPLRSLIATVGLELDVARAAHPGASVEATARLDREDVLVASGCDDASLAALSELRASLTAQGLVCSAAPYGCMRVAPLLDADEEAFCKSLEGVLG